jgi:predicted alpha/beta hydrolase family esterase
MRAVIVPGGGAEPDTAWYEFLSERVRAGAVPGLVDAAFAPLRPSAELPEIDDSVASIQRVVGDAPGSAVLVGHSLGARAVLHYLAGLPPGRDASGFLAVAGWWEHEDPAPDLVPWIEQPLDLHRARAAVRHTRVLISDNDPFTPDWEHNERLWLERMGADVVVRPGGKHFNGAHEAAVLINLAALAMAVAEES